VKDFFFTFPWFPMCSHYVPFKFPIGSHQVQICSPSSQCVLNSTSLLSHSLFSKCCPPSTYIGGQKGRNSTLF
jgi:hypothetical protein